MPKLTNLTTHESSGKKVIRRFYDNGAIHSSWDGGDIWIGSNPPEEFSFTGWDVLRGIWYVFIGRLLK